MVFNNRIFICFAKINQTISVGAGKEVVVTYTLPISPRSYKTTIVKSNSKMLHTGISNGTTSTIDIHYYNPTSSTYTQSQTMFLMVGIY